MKTNKTQPKFDLDLSRFSWAALVYVVAKAEELKCTPHQAALRILEERAALKVGHGKEAA